MTMARASVGRIPTWDVADKLVKARTSAGFSQTELAEAMGVGRATVARAEQGVATPRRPVFLAWAFATGVDLDWLMSVDEPTPPGCPHQGSNLGPADYKSGDSTHLTGLRLVA